MFVINIFYIGVFSKSLTVLDVGLFVVSGVGVFCIRRFSVVLLRVCVFCGVAVRMRRVVFTVISGGFVSTRVCFSRS